MESASSKQSLKYTKPKQKTLGSKSPTCVQRERVLFVWSCMLHLPLEGGGHELLGENRGKGPEKKSIGKLLRLFCWRIWSIWEILEINTETGRCFSLCLAASFGACMIAL